MTHGTYQERPRVVVGIDGSPAACAAVEFAVREARLRGARLVAVTALAPPDLARFDPYTVHGRGKAEIVARAEQTVATALAGLDTDGLDLRVVVSTDTPARALIDRSAFADLLVVGSRGRGGIQGLALGSVSLQCVLHARCPVTVVHLEPTTREDADRSANVVGAGRR